MTQPLTDSREDAVRSYRSIASQLNQGSDIFPFLDDLAPYACRRLLYGESVSDLACVQMAFTGIPNVALHFFDSEGRSIAVVEGSYLIPTICALPLDGHRLSSTSNHVSFIREALNYLRDFFPIFHRKVMEWTSLVVWLELSPFVTTTLITSSTFPHFPHCTFLSDKALRHIPPNSVGEGELLYAFAENLFHEALHQELTNTLVFADILKPEYQSSGAKKIDVSWRQQRWEPDRVFHAAYVYAHLLKMRQRALSSHFMVGDQKIWLASALIDGEDALRNLLEKLDRCGDVFTKIGLEWVSRMRCSLN